MRNFFYKFLALFNKVCLSFTQNKLRVLAYHTVEDKSNFENQIQYLQKNYNIIDIKALEDHIFQQKRLPKKALLVTFDDGDFSVYESGLPIIKKFKFPVILFVITDLINSSKPFWWDEIRNYIGEKEGNKMVWETKTWNNKKREEYLEGLRAKNKDNLISKVQLSDKKLKELNNHGVLIANHSHSHPMFNKLTDEEVREELETSSLILISSGFSNNIFAYPNGNFDEKVEKILEEKNIKMAFLFDHKLNSKVINPLRISRLRVDAHTPLSEFKVKVSGLHSFIYNMTKN